MALVIHKPARPAAPSDNVAIESNIVTKTDKAPNKSKFNISQRFVIQQVYHIYKAIVSALSSRNTVILCYTLVVVSILMWRLSRNRFSAENARTVTIPSRSSPKSEKMGDLVFDSMRRRSRPVLRYPTASSQYAKPMMHAGRRNQGNTTLHNSQISRQKNSVKSRPSRNRDDRRKKTGKRGIHSLQRTRQGGINSFDILAL